MGGSEDGPGNANLPIGGGRGGSLREGGAGGTAQGNGEGGGRVNGNVKDANREIGGPRGDVNCANLEIGVPRGKLNYANLPIGVPGWHSRGYLPHFDAAGVVQHVTFHLADSLPRAVWVRLRGEVRELERKRKESKTKTPIGRRGQATKPKTPIGRLAFPGAELRKRVEAFMDAGHGACILRVACVAEMVQGSLLAFDSLRYRLLAWVVMPNHVHVLFEPLEGWSVAKIVAGWKKFTARGICDYRRDTGSEINGAVWHREYWDRFIRDRRHFERAVQYIHMNPVSAGLVQAPEDWVWGSAYFGEAGKGKSKDANREIGVPRGLPREKP